MKKIKVIEKTFYRFRNDNTDVYIEKEFLDFWKHYDEIFHTNHFDIISMILSPEADYCTLEGIALKVHVSERTLLRYRNLYAESYLTFQPSPKS